VPHRPFTQPWADAYRVAINANAAHRAIAQGWIWPLALVLNAQPDIGYPEDVGLQLELNRGDCGGARVLAPAEITAPFSLRGSYATWKRIVRGEFSPIAAVIKGDLKLTGSLATLVQHTNTAKALVACAQLVETEFPDE
jgi:putative sterol carrier protein